MENLLASLPEREIVTAFEVEIFSGTVRRVHMEFIPPIRYLRLTPSEAFALAETIARKAGAREVIIR